MKRIHLNKTGDFTIGLQSNIGFTFPHPTLNLSIVDGAIWFEHVQILHPCSRNIWAYTDRDCCRCVVEFKPIGQSLWAKHQSGFTVLFAAAILLVMWFHAVERFYNQDSLPIVATMSWTPVQIRTQAYLELNRDGHFKKSYLDLSQSGPMHQADDAHSQVAYYPWYRSQVKTAGLLPQLLRQHQQNQANAETHWMLGLYAYAADDPKLALWHFYKVEQLSTDENQSEERLYWTMLAYRRLGYHQQEARIAEKLLAQNPDSINILGAMANLKIRTRNFAELESLVQRLEQHPDSAMAIAYIEVQYNLAMGSPIQALEGLRGIFQRFGSLNAHMRTEIVRDIAIDPLFSDLRSEASLRHILIQFYGSEAPESLKSFSD